MDKKKVILAKQKDHAFGKDVYLLGKDKNGERVWLEAATWDCGWYWGFGYVERYQNNRQPSKAKDISSHTHWDTGIIGKKDEKGTYIHHINENPEFVSTVLTEKESWTLSELMKTFYILRESAETFGRGGAHITNNPAKEVIKNEYMAKKINEIMLPAIFSEVYKLLSPKA